MNEIFGNTTTTPINPNAFSGGGGSVTVDQTYNPESEHAQSGKAVAEAFSNSGLLETQVGDNLVNPETIEVGAIESNGTIATNGSWATYITSDYIELEANTDYVFTCHDDEQQIGTTYRKKVLLFDKNKNVITNSFQNIDGANFITFNSSNAKYARVASRNIALLQLRKGTGNSPFVPYKIKSVMNTLLGAIPYEQTKKDNVLYKKKWAVFGDSFTNGSQSGSLTEGKYKGYRKTYPYFIGNRNEMEIIRFFDGGKTLAYPADGTFDNSITCPTSGEYYRNIPTDVDYITIYLGINDSNHFRQSSGDGESVTGMITLGTIDDATTSTYYGAWNEILTWLIENRPFAHIGIIVSNGFAESEYQGVSGDDWRQATINIAKKYGIPYIDLNGDERTPAMIRSINPNISNAVKILIDKKQAVDYDNRNFHPNDEAHEYESYFIENFLRSL